MFNAQQSFEDNLTNFKAACEAIDPDCTKILFDNIDLLIKHGADRSARTDFNGKVKAALDSLPTAEKEV